MRIKRVLINNFRSIKNKEIDFEDFNVLVGPNNSGKSNVVKALDLYFNYVSAKEKLKDQDFHVDPVTSKSTGPIEIIVTFSGINELLESIDTKIAFYKKAARERRKRIIRKFYKKSRDELTAGIRFYKNKNIEKLLVYYKGKTTKEEKDSLFKYISDYTFFYYLDPLSGFAEEINPYGPSLLRGVMDIYLRPKAGRKSKGEQVFVKALDSFISELKGRMSGLGIGTDEFSIGLKYNIKQEIGISRDSVADVLRNFSLSFSAPENPVPLPIEYQGAGIQKSLVLDMVYFINTYVLKDQITSAFLAIEEPEAFLHPTGQYNVLKKLLDATKNENRLQIFITTHSPLLIKGLDLNKVKRARISEGSTSFSNPPSVSNVSEGNNLKTLLFANKALFVEGPNDARITEYIALSLYPDFYAKSIEIIPLGGKERLRDFADFCNTSGVVWAGLLDFDGFIKINTVLEDMAKIDRAVFNKCNRLYEAVFNKNLSPLDRLFKQIENTNLINKEWENTPLRILPFDLEYEITNIFGVESLMSLLNIKKEDITYIKYEGDLPLFFGTAYFDPNRVKNEELNRIKLASYFSSKRVSEIIPDFTKTKISLKQRDYSSIVDSSPQIRITNRFVSILNYLIGQ